MTLMSLPSWSSDLPAGCWLSAGSAKKVQPGLMWPAAAPSAALGPPPWQHSCVSQCFAGCAAAAQLPCRALRSFTQRRLQLAPSLMEGLSAQPLPSPGKEQPSKPGGCMHAQRVPPARPSVFKLCQHSHPACHACFTDPLWGVLCR